MSHYTRVNTRLVSTQHLLQALRDMGFGEVECHEPAQVLYNYVGEATPDRAHVIVRREHLGRSSNDLGFRKTADGSFAAIVSDFDRHRLDAVWLKELTQRYAYHVARDTLTEQGFDLVGEERQEDGTIQLTLRRMAG